MTIGEGEILDGKMKRQLIYKLLCDVAFTAKFQKTFMLQNILGFRDEMFLL